MSYERNGKASLQSQEVMKRLKLTNSYASKVMLAKREGIIKAAQQPSQTKISNEVGIGEVKPDFGPKTPSRRQSNANYAAQLAEDFKSSSEAWNQHLMQKNLQLELSNLKYAFKIGLITDEEMKRKAASLLKR
jgi:hypothetical protein